jgi:hypothetical protein
VGCSQARASLSRFPKAYAQHRRHPSTHTQHHHRRHHHAQERGKMIAHISKQPDRQWTNSAWSFKNDAKVYGSPMMDALWDEALKVRSNVWLFDRRLTGV